MCVVTRSPCGNPAASHSPFVSARPVGETSHIATLQASERRGSDGPYLDRPRKAREVHMTEFAGRTAVVTGGGSGMGRELVRQLVAEACNVAMCDVSPTGLAETQRLCETAGLPQGLRVTTHIVDVADRTQVERFRDEVADRHQTDKV